MAQVSGGCSVKRMPKGCVCPVQTWVEKPWPVCKEHVGKATAYCRRCEHDAACHKGSK